MLTLEKVKAQMETGLAAVEGLQEQARLAGKKEGAEAGPADGPVRVVPPQGGGRAGVAIRFRCAWRGGTVRGNPLHVQWHIYDFDTDCDR